MKNIFDRNLQFKRRHSVTSLQIFSIIKMYLVYSSIPQFLISSFPQFPNSSIPQFLNSPIPQFPNSPASQHLKKWTKSVDFYYLCRRKPNRRHRGDVSTILTE